MSPLHWVRCGLALLVLLAAGLVGWAQDEDKAPAAPPGPRQPAFLGVQTQELTPELKKRLNVEAETGVVVTGIVQNSAAARAGLKFEDVITVIDDQPVKDPLGLREAIQKAGVGKKITLQVVRGKEKQKLEATLRGLPGSFPAPAESRFPPGGPESMFDPGRRIRELEKRVEELEKRVRDLEKKK